MSIIAVALPLMFVIVRFTRSMFRLELFADRLIRKLPDRFAFLMGCVIVAFGVLSISICVMFASSWLPA